MPDRHDTITVVSMAVVASAAATLLHEAVGHGVTAWLRGDIPTELTSNHLSDVRADRLVSAGGTIVNLVAGGLSLLAARGLGERANARYFFWLLGALNLLPGAGYFLFSGVCGIGDWQAVIAGVPHYALVRIAMTVLGLGFYMLAVRLLGVTVTPFSHGRRDYNAVARTPYYAACVFSCVAGAFDPLGLKVFFMSTVPAAFGGLSGLMWGDNYVPERETAPALWVRRQAGWWIVAAVVGVAYVLVVGRGIEFAHKG